MCNNSHTEPCNSNLCTLNYHNLHQLQSYAQTLQKVIILLINVLLKSGCNHAFPQKTQGCFQFDETTEEFQKKTWVPGCDSAELVEKQGVLYQIGGPLETREQLCRSNLQFMFPFEAGFVMNFTTAEDNTPQGCGTLDGEWRLFNMRPVNEPNYIYPGMYD